MTAKQQASVQIFPISAKSLFNDHLVTRGPKAKIRLSKRSSLGARIDAGNQTFSCLLELQLLLEPPTQQPRQTFFHLQIFHDLIPSLPIISYV